VASTAVAAGVLLASGGAAAADWNFPRGPVSGSGANLSETAITPANVGSMRRVWARGESVGYAGGVTSADGRVFYGTGSDIRMPNQLVARSIRTGALLWRRTLPGPTFSTPVLNRGRVFVAVSECRLSPCGRLYALSARTGAVLWWHGVEGSMSALPDIPVVHGGRVFVMWGDSDGTLSALDEDTGATIWRRTHVQSNLPMAFASRHLFLGAMVYSPAGHEVGSYPVPSAPVATAIANGEFYEVASHLQADGTRFSEALAYPLDCAWVDPLVGCQPVWRVSLPVPVDSAIAVTKDRVLVPTGSWTYQGPGGLLALSTSTGHIRWSWTATGDHQAWQLTVGGGVAYLETLRLDYLDQGRLHAFATRGCAAPTCSPLGSWPIGDQGITQNAYPVIDDGTVLIWNDWADGLWAFRPN
jgi:outer membrane protein assembly factor BamB